VAYGVTDVAAPGTLNLLAAVVAFARLAWQQNVASFFDSKGAHAPEPLLPTRPPPPWAPHKRCVCVFYSPPRGGVFQRGGGARQVAGPLRRRLKGSDRPRGGQTTRPRWVCSPSMLQCMCFVFSPPFAALALCVGWAVVGQVWSFEEARAALQVRSRPRRFRPHSPPRLASSDGGCSFLRDSLPSASRRTSTGEADHHRSRRYLSCPVIAWNAVCT